jgi:proline iminopeptidase
MDEYIADLDAVRSHFRLNQFHLFGHSWGGLYAQIYAEKHPERMLSLFLCSPASGTGDVWKQTEKEILCFNKKQCTRLGWMKMGLKSLLGLLGSDRAQQSLFKQVLDNYNKGFYPSWAAPDVQNVRAEPANKTRLQIRRYPPLKETMHCPFPVMITYGDRDIYGEGRQQVLMRLPGARYIEFRNSGHIPWKQNAEDFFKILTEFYELSP